MTHQTILVVAAHPDDEILGCGATIANHVAKGDDVHMLIMAEDINSRDEAGSDALSELHQQAQKANNHIGAASCELATLPDNRMDSIDLLDVVKIVEKHITRVSPDLIYTHFANDLNIDHRITHNAVMTACRPQPGYCVRTILTFEVPSSTEWNSGYHFVPNWFVPVSQNDMQKKQEALAIYASEMRDAPHARSIETCTALATVRGHTIGKDYAEAFMCIRNITK